MYTCIFVAVILLFVESVSGAHVDDTGIIIGSSVGGVIGLVNLELKRNDYFHPVIFSIL